MFAALQGKDASTLAELTLGVEASYRDAFRALPELYGDMVVLQEAQQRLPQVAEIKQALQDLSQAAKGLAEMGIPVSFDLAELRGYHYHSGMVFAAYADGCAGAIALGGRYDQVGQAFGRARPATGFSMDMRALIGLLPPCPEQSGILAPFSSDKDLQAKINALRADGQVVIVSLPKHESHETELNCDRKLVNQGHGWEVVPVE